MMRRRVALPVVVAALLAVSGNLGVIPAGAAAGSANSKCTKKPFVGTVERTAVMRAMENALPNAEAAAQIMSTRIATIFDVRVVEIAWNQDPEYGADQPDTERASCSAKVEVVYVLE